MLGAEVEVGQANLAVYHPGRLMPGRQHAEFVRRPLCVRALAAEGAGAAREVARQGMDLRPLVVPRIVVVAPERRAQAVAQLGTVLQASVGRAAEGLEDLVLFE
ncbi:hypothetical protein D3C81_1822530 [compost metagenome]